MKLTQKKEITQNLKTINSYSVFFIKLRCWISVEEKRFSSVEFKVKKKKIIILP